MDGRIGVRSWFASDFGAAGAGSELAVDAFLVADADLRGGAVIAACDTSDLERLAGRAGHVRIADLDA